MFISCLDPLFLFCCSVLGSAGVPAINVDLQINFCDGQGCIWGLIELLGMTKPLVFFCRLHLVKAHTSQRFKPFCKLY